MQNDDKSQINKSFTFLFREKLKLILQKYGNTDKSRKLLIN